MKEFLVADFKVSGRELKKKVYLRGSRDDEPLHFRLGFPGSGFLSGGPFSGNPNRLVLLFCFYLWGVFVINPVVVLQEEPAIGMNSLDSHSHCQDSGLEGKGVHELLAERKSDENLDENTGTGGAESKEESQAFWVLRPREKTCEERAT